MVTAEITIFGKDDAVLLRWHREYPAGRLGVGQALAWCAASAPYVADLCAHLGGHFVDQHVHDHEQDARNH